MAIIFGTAPPSGASSFPVPFPVNMPVDRVQQSSVFETFVTDDFSALWVNPLWRQPSTVIGELGFLRNTIAGIGATVAAQFDLRTFDPSSLLSGDFTAAADAAAQASICPVA